MPLYEYLCTKCGERTEVCNASAPPRLRSVPVAAESREAHLCTGPQFKGKGWYVTDYAKRSVSADSTDSATAGTAKADRKPDGKSSKSRPNPRASPR